MKTDADIWREATEDVITRSALPDSRPPSVTVHDGI
jgi:hypothetical protein